MTLDYQILLKPPQSNLTDWIHSWSHPNCLLSKTEEIHAICENKIST